jgi:hypothetical protein
MNILELIGITNFNFKTKSDNTSHYANCLARKSDEIEKYFNGEYKYSIDNTEKLIDFLSVNAFSQFELISQNSINLEKDDELKIMLLKRNKIISFIKNIIINFDRAQLIKYLIANADFIFKKEEENKKNIYFIKAIIDISCSFDKGAKIIIENLIKSDYRILLFEYFEKVKNVIIEDDSLLDLFLNSNNAIETSDSTQVNKPFLTAVAVVGRKKGFNNEQIKIIINEVANFINETCEENNIKNWMFNKIQLNYAINFLHSIEYPNIAELQEKIKHYNKNEKKFLEEYGHKNKWEEISLKPYIEYFKNPEIKMPQKLLILTHEDGIHFANSCTNMQESFMSRKCKPINPTSKTFDINYQRNISINNYFYVHITKLFFNECDTQEIFATLCSELDYIRKQYNFFDYSDEQITQDIQLLYDSMNMILSKYKTIKDSMDLLQIKPLYYGTSMLLFGLIEKLLNSIVKAEKKDMFLAKHLRLGSLFLSNPEILIYLKEILTPAIFNYLRYVVHSENDNIKKEEVGRNLRNKFAHYVDCYDEINYGTVIISFLCYLSILNELVYKTKKNS